MGIAREHRDRRHARRRRHADDAGQQHRAARAHRRRPAEDHRRRHGQGPVGRRRSSGRSTRKCRTTTTRACACPTTSRCSSPTTTGATSAACRRAADRSAHGGFGIYYHFDYVGGPRNYKWLNTNPIARVWEQMHLSYEMGRESDLDRERRRPQADGVPDLSSSSTTRGIRARWPAERLPEYTRRWAAQQFGAAHAAEIADLTTHVPQVHRPPQAGAARHRRRTASTNYREAERVVADYTALARRAPSVMSTRCRASTQDAYYQLVLHPIQAAANLNELYVTVARRIACTRCRVARRRTISPTRARQLFEQRRRDLAVLQHAARRRQVESHDGPDAHRLHVLAGAAAQHDAAGRRDPGAAAADMGVAIVERIVRHSRTGRRRWRPPPGRAGGASSALPTFDTYPAAEHSHRRLQPRADVVRRSRRRPAQPWVIVCAAARHGRQGDSA